MVETLKGVVKVYFESCNCGYILTKGKPDILFYQRNVIDDVTLGKGSAVLFQLHAHLGMAINLRVDVAV